MAHIHLKTAIPGPNSIALMMRRQHAVAKGPFHATPLCVARAKGAIVEDVDGNQLIDFAAGIGVINVGHTVDPVVKAVQTQAEMLMHAGFTVTAYEGYIQLCEQLNKATPGHFAKKTFLANSGAEAVENAIKIARAYTKKQGVICFDHAFHGRTYMAMTLTSKAKPYRYGFGPYSPEVYRSPFPYVYRWKQDATEAEVAQACFNEFEQLVDARLNPNQVAAVIIEPVLGEGGFIPASKEFLGKIQRYCHSNNIVLIADEIQSGFGRTGTLFACEQFDFIPDLLTSAKGMGGGMPISAVTGRAEMMDAVIDGGLGGTYGGNPLSCAAALAVFSLFEKGDVLNQARQLGEVLRARLEAWQNQYPVIGDVRGLGPMLAIEFVKNRETKEPHADLVKQLIAYCYERGLIILSAGTYGNVIRFLMPLSIEHEILFEGLSLLESGIRELS